MAFIPVINTAQANFKYDLSGQTVENVLSFVNLDDPDSTLLEGLAGALLDWANASLMPLLSSNLSLYAVTVTNLSSDSSPSIEFTQAPQAGGVGGTALPNNVTWCIQFKTSLRGRSYRGRNYVAGIPNAALDTVNTVSATFATDVQNAYTTLLDPDTLPAGWTWVVVSRYTDGAPRVTGTVTAITSVNYADRYLDSQRRRLPGRGT